MACGLKVLSEKTWYGGGYCGVCGHRGDELIPKQVRYWDPDDGWKVGVLCSHCTEDCEARGPKPTDYARRGDGADESFKAEVAELLAELGDADGAATEYEDLFG